MPNSDLPLPQDHSQMSVTQRLKDNIAIRGGTQSQIKCGNAEDSFILPKASHPKQIKRGTTKEFFEDGGGGQLNREKTLNLHKPSSKGSSSIPYPPEDYIQDDLPYMINNVTQKDYSSSKEAMLAEIDKTQYGKTPTKKIQRFASGKRANSKVVRKKSQSKTNAIYFDG